MTSSQNKLQYAQQRSTFKLKDLGIFQQLKQITYKTPITKPCHHHTKPFQYQDSSMYD